jgi:hypothetical protein
MMTHQKTFEKNKTEFIARLLAAGWTKREALEEWDRIQDDEESDE